MAFQIKAHGGWCCGMIHVHNIPVYHPTQEAALLALCQSYVQNFTTSPRQRAVALEMIFTDTQLQGGWLEALDRIGFRRTVRWRNPNSRNYCNQFILAFDEPPEGGY